MIKPVPRDSAQYSSLQALEGIVRYLSNPKHSNHRNKAVLPAQNYNCPGNSANEFIGSILIAEEQYQKFREGKRGKRTKALFQELVYSSQNHSKLTHDERDFIEKLVISKLPPNTPIRTAWHIDKETGREDMHILLSAKTIDYPPKVSISAHFGNGGRHIFAEFTLLDTDITRMLNGNPNRKPLTSMTKKRKENAAKFVKAPPLAHELARAFARTKLPIAPEAIEILTKKLGYEVKSFNENFMLVKFRPPDGKTRRFGIPKLIHDTQLALNLNKVKNTHDPEREIN